MCGFEESIHFGGLGFFPYLSNGNRNDHIEGSLRNSKYENWGIQRNDKCNIGVFQDKAALFSLSLHRLTDSGPQFPKLQKRRVCEFLHLPLGTERGSSGLKQAPGSAIRAMAPGTKMLPLAQSSGHFRTGIPCRRGCQTQTGSLQWLPKGVLEARTHK